MKRHYLSCSCTSANHTVVFTKDEDFLLMEFQLYQYATFFKRLWLSLKYIFFPKYHVVWDNVLINDTERQKLLEWLESKNND